MYCVDCCGYRLAVGSVVAIVAAGQDQHFAPVRTDRDSGRAVGDISGVGSDARHQRLNRAPGAARGVSAWPVGSNCAGSANAAVAASIDAIARHPTRRIPNLPLPGGGPKADLAAKSLVADGRSRGPLRRGIAIARKRHRRGCPCAARRTARRSSPTINRNAIALNRMILPLCERRLPCARCNSTHPKITK